MSTSDMGWMALIWAPTIVFVGGWVVFQIVKFVRNK